MPSSFVLGSPIGKKVQSTRQIPSIHSPHRRNPRDPARRSRCQQNTLTNVPCHLVIGREILRRQTTQQFPASSTDNSPREGSYVQYDRTFLAHLYSQRYRDVRLASSQPSHLRTNTHRLRVLDPSICELERRRSL